MPDWRENSGKAAASPEYITHSAFAPEGVRYGFFTRRGGVSEGLYDSLNGGFASADDSGRVRCNRERAAAALGFDRIASAHQIHSCIVHHVPLHHVPPHHVSHGGEADKSPPQGDALVTSHAGLALMILTADCVPVLFADTTGGLVAAAHAGWKGALAGIIEATVAAMVDAGSRRQDITAVIGPAIQQSSYQVGSELRDAALADAPDAELWFRPDEEAGKFRFDLPGYVGQRLQQSAITHHRLPHDTYADEDCFFSHRRRTHRNEADTGRLISLVGISRPVHDSDGNELAHKPR